jgi:hypothetical protein
MEMVIVRRADGVLFRCTRADAERQGLRDYREEERAKARPKQTKKREPKAVKDDDIRDDD